MRMGAAKIPFEKIEIAEEAHRPWKIFRELFTEPPVFLQQINRHHFEIFTAQNRCVVEKISVPATKTSMKNKKSAKSKPTEQIEDSLSPEKEGKEAEEHKYLLLAGFMPFKLSLMFARTHIDVLIVRENMLEEQKQLFIWFDLFYTLQWLPHSKLSQAFALVKQYCPGEVAHEFMRGKVTQERFCKQFGFARSTLNNSRSENEQESKRTKISKPSTKNILAVSQACLELPINGK